MFQKILKKIGITNFRNQSIVCVGSSAKDIFFPTSEGNIYETPEDILAQRKISFELGAKYQVEDRAEALGGCAANVSTGIARIGLKVSCYTKIGNDDIGEWIKREMKLNGVSTDLVMTEDCCKSDLSTIIVDKNSGERVIFFNRDANEKLEIKEDLLKKFDWVFVSALNGKWEENIKKIIDFCDKNSIKIAFNPGQRNIKDNPELIMEVVSKSSIVMLNKDEAIEILSSRNLMLEGNDMNNEVFLLKEILKITPGVATLTDGQKGAWFGEGEDIFHAAALISQAVDTTGAGDSFTSGFLAGYMKNASINSCVRMGVVNSSSVVKKFGAIEGLLNEREIYERLNDVKIEKVN